MSGNKQTYLSPVGRIVQGDCFKGSTTDLEGNPLTIKSGPNAGQPRTEYYIAVAFQKTDPKWPALYNTIMAKSKECFPNLFDPQGNCVAAKFSNKIVDGDSTAVNMQGNRPCDKEGYPGHWVVTFKSGFAPTCYAKGGKTIIEDPEMIKRGYYVRIFGTIDGNNSQTQPGVILNHNKIELCGHGQEIVSGISGEEAFGGEEAVLPAGASEVPLAPAESSMPGAQTGAPAPGPQTQAPAPQQAPVQPDHDFLNGPQTGAPAPGPQTQAPAPQQAPAPEIKYVLPDGSQWTKQQLLDSNWAEANIEALPRA